MENFKQSISQPAYKISDQGKVVSLLSGKEMKTRIESNGYERVNLSNKGKVSMCSVHRLVAEAFLPNPEGLPLVDHKDRNKSNNTLANLKWATHSANNQNRAKRKNSTSQYHGVYWNKRAKKWKAHLRIGKKMVLVGYFSDEKEAAGAYNEAALKQGLHNINHFENAH